MPSTRMSRTLAAVAGFVAVGALAVSPAFAHGRVVRATRKAPANVVIRMETVHVKGSTLKVFATANGLTLYYPVKATMKADWCKAGICTKLWPPFTVPKGTRVVGPKGVKGFSVGLTDGRNQVAFRGHPLFRFGADKKPGQLLGQGFKKLWWAATPALKAAWVAPAKGAKTKSGSTSSSGGGW